LGTIPLGAADPIGKIGLLLALVGILFAVGGASIDTVFAGANNLAQFCGWEWGRSRSPKGPPRFILPCFVLLVADGRPYMGRYGNGRLANVLGVIYLVVIIVVAVTAIPLLILTNAGQ